MNQINKELITCNICNKSLRKSKFYKDDNGQYMTICKNCFEKILAAKYLEEILKILKPSEKFKEKDFLIKYPNYKENLMTLKEQNIIISQINDQYDTLIPNNEINNFLKKYLNNKSLKIKNKHHTVINNKQYLSKSLNSSKETTNYIKFTEPKLNFSVKIGKSFSSGGWAIKRKECDYLIPKLPYENECDIIVDGIHSKAKLNIVPRIFFSKSNKELYDHLKYLHKINPNGRIKIEFLLNKEKKISNNYLDLKKYNEKILTENTELKKI